jgi:hypothetical protein
MKLLAAPPEVKESVAERFACFRNNRFQGALGQSRHLHDLLSEALLLIFARMKKYCDETSQGFLLLNGLRIQPKYTEPAKPIYAHRVFDKVDDPPFFRTRDIR